ncbi:alpha/beta hydrolase [Poseidonocella sp. HB161398]|uniref:alpha/beta hydrolase n=1 Tax=Poseidonocella sp. HB161398 TaxID=2320855 RepID=UPI001109447E|nr:alpha/beta fold hydrolase [Poseidonocella sp. HB161398]
MTLHLPPLAGESWHVRPGGPRLFLRAWRPAGPVRAALVISHGVKSHSGQYEAAARSFAAAGPAVHAADLRGRGRSDGARFRVGGIADYVSDLAVAVEEAARARDPGLPVFLLGHSAGGVVAATYALEHPGRRAGLIPGRLPHPGAEARAEARQAAGAGPARHPAEAPRFHPRPGGPGPARGRSADPRRGAARRHRGRHAARQRAAGAQHGGRVRLPLLVLHGTGDRATLAEGSRDFAARAGPADKTLRLYPGHVHDLRADASRDAVLGDVLAWIGARLDPACFSPRSAT